MRLLTIALLLAHPLGPLLTAADQPNILMIAIDDQNDWIGCLGGHPQARTPGIDALAERRGMGWGAVQVRAIEDPEEAVRVARAELEPGRMLCATGSVYLAGIARRVLGGAPARGGSPRR